MAGAESGRDAKEHHVAAVELAPALVDEEVVARGQCGEHGAGGADERVQHMGPHRMECADHQKNEAGAEQGAKQLSPGPRAHRVHGALRFQFLSSKILSGLTSSPCEGAVSLGSVPAMNTSVIPSAPGDASSPVVASICMTLTPGGWTKSRAGRLASALLMNSIQMGSALRAPASPRPRERPPSSKPTQTAARRSGVKPTNQ